MKYLIYALVMLSGYGLTFGLLPLVLPMWIAIDLVLVLVLCTAQVTKDYTGFFLGLIFGLLVDIFISPAFGLYTLIYCSFGYIYARFCSKVKNDNIFYGVIAIFLFYILKDFALMAYGIIYNTPFPLWVTLWNMTLPSALATAASGFILYLFVQKIHELRFLKNKRELDFLRSYREEYDWLGNWFEQFK